MDNPTPKLTQEERLKEAYHRQGLKIAYVEKEQSKNGSPGFGVVSLDYLIGECG